MRLFVHYLSDPDYHTAFCLDLVFLLGFVRTQATSGAAQELAKDPASVRNPFKAISHISLSSKVTAYLLISHAVSQRARTSGKISDKLPHRLLYPEYMSDALGLSPFKDDWPIPAYTQPSSFDFSLPSFPVRRHIHLSSTWTRCLQEQYSLKTISPSTPFIVARIPRCINLYQEWVPEY